MAVEHKTVEVLTMGGTNAGNIGFEKQICGVACVLRGNLDASKYKSAVLGLIFLKYISDRFEAKYNEPVEEGRQLRGGQVRVHR